MVSLTFTWFGSLIKLTFNRVQIFFGLAMSNAIPVARDAIPAARYAIPVARDAIRVSHEGGNLPLSGTVQ